MVVSFQRFLIFACTLLALCFTSLRAVAQDSSGTAPAGSRYNRSGLHQFLWGKHYRREWQVPVTAPVLPLRSRNYSVADSSAGSIAYQLLLTAPDGRRWWLRSVDKKYVSRLPDVFQGTLIEPISKDQVSIAHPFAALTVPVMAKAAGVLYTQPQLVYVPKNELPDSIKNYGDALFYLEPDVISGTNGAITTIDLYNRFYADAAQRVNQRAFVRSRLFDMFLGDWRRSEGRWLWMPQATDSGVQYQPLPVDRDGAYTKFDGLFPVLISNPEDLEKFKSFGDRIKNVKKFNSSARFLDRQLTNEIPLQSWLAEAASLQQSLTDAVIDNAVQQMPAGVYAISGAQIAAHLKARRDGLTAYAKKYYSFVNDEVEVTGTTGDDEFVIDVDNARNTHLRIYKQGSTQPFFDRHFDAEPDEIRIYGLTGNDRYIFNGDRKPRSKIRIIDRQELDSIHYKGVTTQHNIRVYNNHLNTVGAGTLRSQLAEESLISDFDYRGFEPNKGSIIKTPNFNNLDQLFISLGYRYRHQEWGKTPFDWQQSLKFNYSISQRSPSIEYEGVFHQAIGKWSLGLFGRWDPTSMNNFFGLGNETSRIQNIRTRYYRLFTNEYTGTVNLQRLFGTHHRISIDAGYNSARVSTDDEFFVTKDIASFDPDVYNRKHFGLAQVQYIYTRVNDAVVPTKGFNFYANGGYTINLKETDRRFWSGGTGANLYLPFGKNLSASLRAGVQSVSGETEFYQLPWIGGGQTLRGYRRGRFWGKTAFHNNNDLRYLWNTRNRLFTGKMGFVGTFDVGRVWLPGEESNRLHMGYGGGFLIAPFNRTTIQVGYAISEEDRVFNIRIGTRLF